MGIDTTHRGGARLYFDTGDPDRLVPGVTSAIDMLPKEWLPRWYAGEAARLAVAAADSLPERIAADGPQRTASWLAGAARRYNRLRREIGTKAHAVFEAMIEGGNPRVLNPDVRPYKAQFAAFLAAVNPEHIRGEWVAWSETHGYAGRFDEMMTVWLDAAGRPTPDRSGEAFVTLDDWKTSKDPHAEVSLQLAAYRNADWMINTETGERLPMPAIDRALMLHITDTGWTLFPVRADEDDFRIFLLLLGALRAALEWDGVLSREALGKPIASGGTGRKVA